jgi:DNA-binding MarR family transcriptional regulator
MTARAHPVNQLDELVHQRVRLGILAVLTESTRADFTFLRDTLDLTDGNLARHLQTLESAGLVELEKTFEGRRPRTWVRATDAGRSAFAREIATLQALIRRVRSDDRH